MAKAIDVLVSYNPQAHTRLVDALTTIGRPLAPMIALNEGELIGIEVEVSAPEKTGPANVQQNHAHGVALNVIAVLPRAVTHTEDALRTTLQPNLYARVVVIDVLLLLARLESKL